MAQALYEHQEGDRVPEGAIDGTEGMLGDDTLETDWDLADGNLPPPGFWRGTHRRDGCRIPGLAEEEYLKGESWAIEKERLKMEEIPMSEEEKYRRKAELLKRALRLANEMDKVEAERGKEK